MTHTPENDAIRQALDVLSDLEDHACFVLNDGYTVRRVRELEALLTSVIPPGMES